MRSLIRQFVVLSGLIATICPSVGQALNAENEYDQYHQDGTTYFYDPEVDPRGELSLSGDPLGAQATKDLSDQLSAYIQSVTFNPIALPDYEGQPLLSTKNITVFLLPEIPAPIKGEIAAEMTGFPWAQGGSIPHPKKPASDPYAVTNNFAALKLTASSGELHLKDIQGRDAGSGKVLTFRAHGQDFDYLLDGRPAKFEGLGIITEVGQLTRVEWSTIYGKRNFEYYGNFTLTPDTTPHRQACIKVYNSVGLEKYVAETLPAELPAYIDVNAQMALSIPIRGNALNKLLIAETILHRSYHIKANSQDQLYKGFSGERADSNLAALKTEGLIPVCGEHSICFGMFGANDGGHTVAFRDFDPLHRNISYLPARAELDPQALRRIPNSGTWDRRIDPVKFIQVLKSIGANFKDPMVLVTEPLASNESLRATGIKIYGKTSSINLYGEQFRKLIGSREGLNLNAYMDPGFMKNGKFSIINYGSGPGVGLCQLGADMLAKRLHYNYKQILEFYYPGSKISHFDSTLTPTNI